MRHSEGILGHVTKICHQNTVKNASRDYSSKRAGTSAEEPEFRLKRVCGAGTSGSGSKFRRHHQKTPAPAPKFRDRNKKFRLRLSRKILRKRSSAEVPQPELLAAEEPEEPEVPALWFRLGILIRTGCMGIQAGSWQVYLTASPVATRSCDQASIV